MVNNWNAKSHQQNPSTREPGAPLFFCLQSWREGSREWMGEKKQEGRDEGNELKFIAFSDSMEASNYRIKILFSDADTIILQIPAKV